MKIRKRERIKDHIAESKCDRVWIIVNTNNGEEYKIGIFYIINPQRIFINCSHTKELLAYETLAYET